MKRAEFLAATNQTQGHRFGSPALLLSLFLLPILPSATLASTENLLEGESRSPSSSPTLVPIESIPSGEPWLNEVLRAEVSVPSTDASAPTPAESAASPDPSSTSNPEAATSADEPTQSSDTQQAAPTAEPTDASETPATNPTNTESPSEVETESEAKSEEANSEAAEPEPTPEELSRQQKLLEADQLYLGGQFAAAEALYRQAKPPLAKEAEAIQQRPAPIVDPAALPPGGQVFWREAEAGIAQKLETRTMVPLNLLLEKYPQFIPGHLRMAQVLREYGRLEEALTVLERATTLYPTQPDLLKAKVELLAETEQWLEASIAARQFALLNPQDPAAPEFATLADQNLERFQKHVRRELRGNAIANAITGALGYVLTGNIFGPLSAVQTTALLLRGESSVGESVAKQAKKELELVEDPLVVDYVNEIGRRIATVAGRDFNYEFYVVLDDRLNAFALPGGKVFINAGAIAKTNSEAELAGLLAHELAHAVLSHGFQLVAEGSLVANATQYIPLGGTLANLFVLDYSRDMERQADILGTRILASTGYAADGLRNLMVTLGKEDKDEMPFSWLSTHPVTDERVRYLESLLLENGYNRYAYEGVARHNQVKVRVKQLIAEKKKQEAEKKERREKRDQTEP